VNITIERLEDCITYMAKAIEIRPDGDLYIPIFESLEDEIQKRRSKTDTKSRISLLKSASNTHDLCVVESSVLL